MKTKALMFVQIFMAIILISCREKEMVKLKNQSGTIATKNLSNVKKRVVTKNLQHDFTGNYLGIFNGTEITMQLFSNENSVTGNLVINGEQAKVSATVDNFTFDGKITEDVSHKTYTVAGEWKDEKLHFSMTFPEYNNQTVTIILEKIGDDNTVKSKNNRNPSLVGTWRYTEVLSSGSGGNYMSFSTDYFVKFSADGSFASWTGKSAGGFQNSSIESAGGNASTILKWHTSGKQLILTNPDNNQTESMNYYAETNRMMLSTNKSKRVYQRVY